MARELKSRLKIKGILVAETPIHVGGYGESFETDMALAKNGNDEFYIPGTSLTGTLRSWFEKSFPNDVDSIWGCQIGDKGHASFILIEDLPLLEQVQSELRDGVGIDRHYGTAAHQAKFDRAILPKDTKLKFEMCVEIQDAEAKIKAMFGHLLKALQNGEIRLGAAKTRGLGKVRLSKPELLKVQNLADFASILDVLQNGGEDCSIQDLINSDTTTKPNPGEKLAIDITWQPKSSLMVKASYEGIGVDTLPLVSGSGNGKVSLILPGSSTKGVFRSHAERILRTFSGATAKGEEFHEQINLDLIIELFGAKKEKTPANPRLGLGALSVDDCFAADKMDATLWQSVEAGEFDNEQTYSATGLHRRLKVIDGETVEFPTKRFHISHHTAIDRFTGAASDGALFSVLKPSNKIAWDNLKLSLDLSRVSNDKASVMLLLLVLRDFAENRLPLGFAVNRGMGEVKNVSFEISGKYNISYQAGQFNFKDDENIVDNDKKIKTLIQEEWKKWIETNQT